MLSRADADVWLSVTNRRDGHVVYKDSLCNTCHDLCCGNQYAAPLRAGDAAADVTSALRESLAQFEHSKPGFLTSQALLHGVETRTSCPVTIGAPFSHVAASLYTLPLSYPLTALNSSICEAYQSFQLLL